MRNFIQMLAFIACVASNQFAQATQRDLLISANIDPQYLLKRGDEIRNPQRGFSVDVELREYRDRKLSATSSLTVFSKPDETSGQYNSLLRFTKPSNDANKLMLKNGKDLWFYDPASQVSIRISPRARLLGQASNGDVMAVNFADQYDAKVIGLEETGDGSAKKRNTVHLELKARKGSQLIYPKANYWADPQSGEPIKVEFRTVENRLLKTVFFRGLNVGLDSASPDSPSETIIIDGLNSNWVTVIRSSNVKNQDVPEGWLNRTFLPRFLAELGG